MDNLNAAGIGYAGFWKRFAAFLIDALIITIVGAGVGIILAIFLVYAFDVAPDALVMPAAEAGFNILGLLIGSSYFIFMECSSLKGTIGKIALGIKVTDLEGNQIGFGKAFCRYFLKILSAIIIGIGFLMVAFTERKQGLHDSISGCLVVNK